MQIVRHAQYVGTMIGPNGHLHRWTALRKKFMQRVMKINASTKSLVERLCDFKIYAISVLSFIGSRLRTMPFSVPQQDRTTLSPLHIFRWAPSVGLVLIWLAFILSVQRVAIGLQHAHPLSAEVLNKVNEARWHNCTPLLAHSPAWEQEFLFPSMTFHTVNAFDIVCQLDRNDTLDEVPQNKKQKVATGLLLDKLHKQDFAGPLACRASRVLGPISRHRVASCLT